MFRITLAFLVLVLCGPALVAGTPAEELPPVNRWLPPEAPVVIEVSQPLALLEPLLSPDAAQAAAGLPVDEKGKLKLQQFQGIVAYLELQLGTNWRTALRQLLGQGLTFAVEPGGGVLLCADAQDEKLPAQLHEVIRRFVNSEAAKLGHPEPVKSLSYRGATVWTFGTNEAHVLLGRRLLLANHPQVLDRVLDSRAETKGGSLANSPFYQAARQALGRDAAATIYLDLAKLRQNPKLKQALAEDSNPLGTLLLADTKEALRQANWLAMGLFVKDGALRLELATDGQAPAASKSAAFASPRADEGLLPHLNPPGRIASLSLYRDLREFYAAKDELFPERTSGLIFFENMMGIFFSGIELTDGVLGEFRPEVRLVVAEQRYDPAIGTPSVQVPAFAAVLRLRHPEKFGETVEEAWQKALGLANFTRGQNALPGLIIDRASSSNVKYTLAYYRPPAGTNQTTIDTRYNYRPTLARPGDYVILGSTDGLATDLIAALQQESANPPRPDVARHSLAEVDGAPLRAILLANREHLVQKNMVEKGHTRQQAEHEIKVLLTLLDYLDQAELAIGREHGRPGREPRAEAKMAAPQEMNSESRTPGAWQYHWDRRQTANVFGASPSPPLEERDGERRMA